MKFTNGFWHMRKEITSLYAVEYIDHRVDGDELILFAPSKHVWDRAVCVDLPVLTITLSSPIENVIKVSLVHHEAAVYKGPFASIANTNPSVTIEDSKDQVVYKTGTLSAVVNKNPKKWAIEFYDGDERLTETSYRNMACMLNREKENSYMVEQLALDVGEYVYGLGERFTPFVKNGQSVDIWNEDGGTASEIAYKNIPFYISNKGYGVLVDNQGDVRYEISSEKVERVQFSVEGERLDYHIVAGHTPKGTIRKYTELTGKPALPPAWSFGLWLTTSFTTNYDEETVTSFIQGMEDRDIPLHVFHYDCYWMKALEWCNFEFDKEYFPEPKEMLQRLKDRGLKICVWINPYIGSKSPLFKEGVENGYFLMRKDGGVFQTDFWQSGAGYVDFTNPAAVEWYQSKLKALLDLGVDSFKTDFGERIPVKDVVWHDGSDPVKMHNHYTYLYNEAVFELLEQERGKGDAAVFARSGSVGSQKFPVHWGGDCTATYPAMAETLRGGLSLACGGFGFWSHDIGGFENMATPDVYKRWCAFGLMSSHSRLHGSTSYRVPWLFDEEACDVLKQFVELKCELMPYLYGQAVKACDGIPMLRPMFVEFNEDRACEPLDRQYMLGDSLLVAPVLNEKGTVEYYLPKGTWVNIITKKVVQGGRFVKEKHDYFSLPVMARENSIVAMGSRSDVPDYDYSDGVNFCLSEFKDGAQTKVDVVDDKGNCVGTAIATCSGNEITILVEGDIKNWDARMIAGNNSSCIIK